jgi:hypothetical protein
MRSGRLWNVSTTVGFTQTSLMISADLMNPGTFSPRRSIAGTWKILAENGYGYGMIVVNRQGQQLPYMHLEALARFMLAKLMIAWLSARQA